jgi:hypothetical protein
MAVLGCYMAALAALTSVTPFAGARNAEPNVPGGPPALRRLNEAQYVNSITDIFGAGINIPGRFEPPLREEGLLAIGESKVVVTPSGFEQYELRAREISDQVLAEKRRAEVMPCTPKSAPAFDDACARQFLTKYGRMLFRRPLDQRELGSFVAASRVAAASSGNFHSGLEAGLARMLVSPFFLFRVEAPARSGGKDARLDSFSLASRVSFLLWNSPPDAALLDAAARGDLDKPGGLDREVDRLIASPKFERGVRAYFWDMFGYNQFDGLTKEQSIYKKYVSQVAKDAEEQNLRTIVAHLVTRNGDYRDLFTTRETFVNRSLASLYKVPVEGAGIDGWVPYTFRPQDQRQGLLALAGFLMLDPSHEGRSSPTNRGKFVREALLCQGVPPPPANVNFALVQDTNNPQFKTARERLQAHQENPVCAGCHAITDPVGLAMENYDAIGQFRTRENGAVIDTSGKLNGKPFKNLLDMQTVLRDDPALPACLSQRVFEYGVGRTIDHGEEPWLEYINERFAQSGYKVPQLMRLVALSNAFRAVSPAAPRTTLSSNTTKGDHHGRMVATQRP